MANLLKQIIEFTSLIRTVPGGDLFRAKRFYETVNTGTKIMALTYAGDCLGFDLNSGLPIIGKVYKARKARMVGPIDGLQAYMIDTCCTTRDDRHSYRLVPSPCWPDEVVPDNLVMNVKFDQATISGYTGVGAPSEVNVTVYYPPEQTPETGSASGYAGTTYFETQLETGYPYPPYSILVPFYHAITVVMNCTEGEPNTYAVSITLSSSFEPFPNFSYFRRWSGTDSETYIPVTIHAYRPGETRNAFNHWVDAATLTPMPISLVTEYTAS